MRKTILILISVLASISLGAQSLSFLQFPYNPRTAAMGGAGAALSADAFSSMSNPAAAALSDKSMAVSASYGQWKASESNLIGFGGFYHFGKMAIGLEARYNGLPAYETFSTVGKDLGQYSPKELAAGANFSYEVIDGLSIGATARFLQSDLYESAKGTGFGIDLGAQYAAGGLRAGAAVCNLGTEVDYGTSKVSMPALAKAGVSYSIYGVTGVFEADYVFSGSLMAAIGAEYSLKDILFVRAGYHYGSGDDAIPSHVSLGLGVRYAGVSLDAAYLTASEQIGGALSIGIGYTF